MMKQKQNGFTMIELLIVIVILGILSAIGLGTFTSSQQKARDSRRKSDLKAIGTTLEVYYNDTGSYPVGDAAGDIIACTDGATACIPGSIWQDANSTVYMVQLPGDPSAGKYFYESDGSYYRIYARLENDKDRDVPEVVGNPGYYPVGVSACVTGNCNYGKASSNVILPTPLEDI